MEKYVSGLKKYWFPLAVFVFLAFGSISSVIGIFRYFSLMGILGLVSALFPFFVILVILMNADIVKNDKLSSVVRQMTYPLCYVMAGIELLSTVMVIPRLFGGDFYTILASGALLSLLSGAVKVALFVVIAQMIKNNAKSVPTKYRIYFYAALFVMVFLVALTAITGFNSGSIGVVLETIGVWLLPLVFLECENAEKTVSESIKVTAAVVVLMLICLAFSGACDSGSNDFDDVFEKDPNTWTEEEEEYVNDLFEWIDEQDD